MHKVDTGVVKRLLKLSKVRQKDIASSLGVSTQFVNQVVNGKRSTITVIKAIAITTNVSVSDLWLEEDPSGQSDGKNP